MNARSGHDVRTSPNRANSAKFASSEIHCFPSPLCAEGPPFRARVWPTGRDLWRVKASRRSLSVAEAWRSKRRSSLWIHKKRKEIHYNLMASCLSKLHSNPTFSIALFSPLGPHSGSGAVPWTPTTPPHSPPLRGRPRDALLCITHRNRGKSFGFLWNCCFPESQSILPHCLYVAISQVILPLDR